MSYFNDFDTILLTLLNNLWVEHFEKVVVKSLDYKINLTLENINGDTTEVEVIHNGESTKNNILIIGAYDKKNEIFKWWKNVNELFFKLIEPAIIKNFGTMETIEKMFKNKVPISHDLYHAIPTLIGIYFSKSNLIKFIDENKTVSSFALIKLDIDNNFDNDNFFNNVNKYYVKDKVLGTLKKLNRMKKRKLKRQNKNNSI